MFYLQSYWESFDITAEPNPSLCELFVLSYLLLRLYHEFTRFVKAGPWVYTLCEDEAVCLYALLMTGLCRAYSVRKGWAMSIYTLWRLSCKFIPSVNTGLWVYTLKKTGLQVCSLYRLGCGFIPFVKAVCYTIRMTTASFIVRRCLWRNPAQGVWL